MSAWPVRALLVCGCALPLVAVACGRTGLKNGLPDGVSQGGAAGVGGNGSGGSGTAGSGTAGNGTAGNGNGGSAIGGAGQGGIVTSAGGGGGLAGNGGGGGMPGVENCVNGIDDDADGKIDCADSDCVAGFTCAPSPPAGWKGPIALYQGDGAIEPPTCATSGGYVTLVSDAFDGLSAAPATCPGCSCSDPKGVSCAVASAQFFGNSQCAGQGGTLTVAAGACVAFLRLSDPQSVKWASATASGGVCLVKTMGAPQIPPVNWAARARSCGGEPEGGGCAMDLCVPRPQGKFGKALCVVHDGDVACPAGPYAKRFLYYQGVADTRGCSDCGCGNPAGMTCTGKLELWDDTGCTTDLTTLSMPGQCAALAPDPTPPPPPYKTLRSIFYTSGPSAGGSCVSTPSNATGKAVPSQPLTICCVN